MMRVSGGFRRAANERQSRRENQRHDSFPVHNSPRFIGVRCD
jgi:hypothetical protein